MADSDRPQSGSVADAPAATAPVGEPAGGHGPPVPARVPLHDEYLGIKPNLDHLRYSRSDLRKHVEAWGEARKEMKLAYELLSTPTKMECWNKPGELRPIVYPEIWDEHKTTIDWMVDRVAGGYAVAMATHDVLQAIQVKFDKAIQQIEDDARNVGPGRVE